MPDVEKRRATLAGRCLNNLYGFYASLHTFLNFLIMWKQHKRNNINHKITSSTISKPSKKKDKRKSQRFWIPTGQTSLWWIIFASVRKSLRNGKKTSAYLKKVLRNYAWNWDLTFRKTKDFEIQFTWRNKWPQRYVALQMKVGSKEWQTMLVSRNGQFRKLSGFFCFYFRKIFSVSQCFSN